MIPWVPNIGNGNPASTGILSSFSANTYAVVAMGTPPSPVPAGWSTAGDAEFMHQFFATSGEISTSMTMSLEILDGNWANILALFQTDGNGPSVTDFGGGGGAYSQGIKTLDVGTVAAGESILVTCGNYTYLPGGSQGIDLGATIEDSAGNQYYPMKALNPTPTSKIHSVYLFAAVNVPYSPDLTVYLTFNTVPTVIASANYSAIGVSHLINILSSSFGGMQPA